MLDRNSSDRLNPVFLRLMREIMRTRLLPGVCALVVAFDLCLAYLLFTRPEDAGIIGGFVSLILPACILCSGGNVIMHVYRARNVDGMDPSLGTMLTPGRIMAGQLLALAASVAIPLLFAIPLLALCASRACLNLTAMAISLTWFTVFMVIILAALQFNASGKGNIKNLSPLWLAIALILIPAGSGVLFLPILMTTYLAERHCLYLFAQAWTAASLVVLSGAAIYGANRPRTLDSTVTLHLTSLAVWIIWFPLLIACNILYPELSMSPPFSPVAAWGVLTILYGIAMLLLASVEFRAPSRRLCAFLHPHPRAPLRWLTLPFQGGAIPGYLLGLLLCLVGLGILAGCKEYTAAQQACLGIAVCYALFYTALSMGLQRCFRLSAGATYAILFAVGALATFCDSIADLGASGGGPSFFGLITGAFFMEGLDTQAVNYLFLLVGLLGLFIFILFNLKPFLREAAGKH